MTREEKRQGQQNKKKRELEPKTFFPPLLWKNFCYAVNISIWSCLLVNYAIIWLIFKLYGNFMLYITSSFLTFQRLSNFLSILCCSSMQCYVSSYIHGIHNQISYIWLMLWVVVDIVLSYNDSLNWWKINKPFARLAFN